MIYFLQEGGWRGDGNVKIGYAKSLDRVDERARLLQTGNSSELEMLLAIPGSRLDEKDYHRLFAADHVRGEWFRMSPRIRRYIEMAAWGFQNGLGIVPAVVADLGGNVLAVEDTSRQTTTVAYDLTGKARELILG